MRQRLEAGIRRGEIRSEIDWHLHPVPPSSALRGIFAQWLISPAKFHLGHAGRYWLAELRRTRSPTRTDG